MASKAVKPSPKPPKSPRKATKAKVAEVSARNKKRDTDWEAVERDFRTGKWTLRELASKYNLTHGAIGVRSREQGWKKDLKLEIQQATNALLTQELVSKEVSGNIHNISETIQAAAEINKQVILGHRKRLADMADAVVICKAKLMALGDSVADIREAATFAQALSNLTSSTKTLNEEERKAFKLDEELPPPPVNPVDGLIDAAEAYKRMLAR